MIRSFVYDPPVMPAATPARNRQWLVAGLPAGKLEERHFRFADAPPPTPGEGQLLVAVRLISIDAANRAWMQGLTYRSALAADEVMAGLGVGEVIESRAPGFAPGDRVFGDLGWQELAAVDAPTVTPQPADVPLTHLLSLYGTSMLTAYHGLTRIGGLHAGETLAVSAAGGSVGTAVAQIGAILGARVIGIAGGAEKCRWLVDDLGVDAALDYRDPGFPAALRGVGGIDVYFDNVGGDVLDRCLFAMNEGGRVVCCGAVASYDGDKPRHGPRGVPGLLVTRRLTMRGFVVTDFDAERDAALAAIRDWAAPGRLRPIEDVIDGLENAPRALIDQLAGRSRGKKMIRLEGTSP